MSDLLAALADSGGFCPDPRFVQPAALPPVAAPADPITEAQAGGYAAGFAEAEAAGVVRLGEALAARGKIELALALVDANVNEGLNQRLQQTVATLCGEVFAIAARDPDYLAKRIDAAAALLARAEDGRVLRLHPDDIALLAGALPEGLPVEPDPTLPPGSLRIEGTAGGIADGPEIWQRALAEALAQC